MLNKIIVKTFLLASFILGSLTASAGTCDQYSTSYDRTYCLSKLFVESDAELNKVYKELKKYIDAETANNLKLVQRKWIKYRNATCEKTPGTILVDCSYDVNVARTNYLQDRVRECKTGSCDKTLISIQSW